MKFQSSLKNISPTFLVSVFLNHLCNHAHFFAANKPYHIVRTQALAYADTNV